MAIRETTITNCEKKFLVNCLSEYTRLDGRAFDEFRNLKIEFGKDWGCCYVSLGRTRVLAQVSCEVQSPNSSRPSEGILHVNVELNPIAAPNFQPGRQSDLSVQLNRLLEKCLKDSKAVDLESLCIQVNEKVWVLRVDINVLNHAGNILDCASAAALAALAHFRRPDVTCDGEEFIIHDQRQRDPIPIIIHHYPVCVTYAIYATGQHIVADPDLLEDGVADAHLTIALNAYRELCSLHLGGKAELTPDIILNTTNKAFTRAKFVIDLIKESIAKDAESRDENSVGFDKGIVEDETITNLEHCLDQWIPIRNKKDKTKVKKKSDEKDGNKIDVIGKGSVALISTDKNGGYDDKISSEDDGTDEEYDDVVFIEKSKEKVVEITDSDSEEENVVVLNADKRTNKRKK